MYNQAAHSPFVGLRKLIDGLNQTVFKQHNLRVQHFLEQAQRSEQGGVYKRISRQQLEKVIENVTHAAEYAAIDCGIAPLERARLLREVDRIADSEEYRYRKNDGYRTSIRYWVNSQSRGERVCYKVGGRYLPQEALTEILCVYGQLRRQHAIGAEYSLSQDLVKNLLKQI